MATRWKGIVASVDWSKKRLLVRCRDGSGASEFPQVLTWDVVTRVTTSDRGIIPIQQLLAGETVSADCVQDQDGRWLARTIEVVSHQHSGRG